MKTEMKDYIVNTNQLGWKPLIENGFCYKGIYVKSLLYNEAKKRSTTIMLKFDAGASYPYHNHPGGEEVFIIEGEAFFNDTKLSKGDFLYTPPNFKHSVKSNTGCVLLFNVPEEVEII